MTSPQSPRPSPSQLIHARTAAFRRCDFGYLFDTYHDASNFRRQFPDREDYIQYGWANLAKDFRILDCTVVREEVAGSEARVILLMEIEFHRERQRYAELAWLAHGVQGWLYRCGQKLLPDEWPVPSTRLDFHHFDSVREKVIY